MLAVQMKTSFAAAGPLGFPVHLGFPFGYPSQHEQKDCEFDQSPFCEILFRSFIPKQIQPPVLCNIVTFHLVTPVFGIGSNPTTVPPEFQVTVFPFTEAPYFETN